MNKIGWSEGSSIAWLQMSSTFMFFASGRKWCHQFSAQKKKQNNVLYIELTISFLIGQKRTVNFHSQRLWHHLAGDYTIIMSRTLKVMGNHITYGRSAWFLRVIMSFARFTLLAVSEETKTWPPFFFFQCTTKQSLDLVFVISRIIKVSVWVISLGLRLWLITPTLTLIILDITKTSSNNCLKCQYLVKVKCCKIYVRYFSVWINSVILSVSRFILDHLLSHLLNYDVVISRWLFFFFFFFL